MSVCVCVTVNPEVIRFWRHLTLTLTVRSFLSVAAGRGEGGMRPERHCAGAACGGSKIWNSEIWPILANWRFFALQTYVIFYTFLTP